MKEEEIKKEIEEAIKQILEIDTKRKGETSVKLKVVEILNKLKENKGK